MTQPTARSDSLTELPADARLRSVSAEPATIDGRPALSVRLTDAVADHGTPGVDYVDQPTFVDTDSAVAWSSSLSTGVRRTAKAGALIGRGSGEALQLSFEGQGFVLVQASEGAPVAVQTA